MKRILNEVVTFSNKKKICCDLYEESVAITEARNPILKRFPPTSQTETIPRHWIPAEAGAKRFSGETPY